MYVPRDYQLECIEAVLQDFKAVRSTLMVLATGTGKTEIFLKIAERILSETPGRVLVIANREELITQPARRWRRDREEWPAIEMAEIRSDRDNACDDLFDSAPINRRLVIASIQTMNSGRRCKGCTTDCTQCNASGNLVTDCEGCEGEDCPACRGKGSHKRQCKNCDGDGWICILEDCTSCFEHFCLRMQKFDPNEFGLIIIDEAHHAIAGTYQRLIRYFRQTNPDVLILGATATPDRSDEEALGRIFESVAYQYSLPKPIRDGWLVGIKQIFIQIDELNLSRVKTTAGDLNSHDLEAEMMAETILHKVTTPLIEVSSGLEMGTIDRLIRTNQLAELHSLCTKKEPTLVYAVDVAHANRMAEIFNRYLPGSALCITGTTPKPDRREGLKRFGEGQHQFLVNCGVFLEGTDLPNVAIIGEARPTKSRLLRTQMDGRGLRPLPGIIDGIAEPGSRVLRIDCSTKPHCLVVDFVGNSGRHKLIYSVDILGEEYDDELIATVIRKAAKSGQPISILKALAEAREAEENTQREKARREASKRTESQRQAEQNAARRRSQITAGATYQTFSIDPFNIMSVAPIREPGYHKGRKPSENMKEFLRKAKVPFTEETTYWQAHCLIDEVIKRRKEGLCTFSQAKLLTKFGYTGNMQFSEADRTIKRLAQNGWRR